MNNSRIPLLKQNASAQDIVNYLNWLWESPFHYHIDECPSDIAWSVEISDEQIKILVWNSDVMWNHNCDDINAFLWDNYYKDFNNN